MGDPRPCLCQVPAASHPPSQEQKPVGSPRAIRTPFLLEGEAEAVGMPAQVAAPQWAGMQLPRGGIVLECWDLGLSPAWSRAGFEAGPSMVWGS